MAIIVSALGLDAMAKYWAAVAAKTFQAEAQQRMSREVRPDAELAVAPESHNRHERRRLAAEARHRRKGR